MPLNQGSLPVKLSKRPSKPQVRQQQAASGGGNWKDYMPKGHITLLEALTDPDPLFPFTEDDDILFERVGLKHRR